MAIFNEMITGRLLDATICELQKNGIPAENITVVKVPGACEIPFAARQMLETNKYAGLITLGAVIQGETPHFHYVCKMVQEGITSLNLSYDKPIIFGVLTTENIAQAMARADETGKNKGADFAKTLLSMLQNQY